jgi:hypothetical protein
MLKTPKSKALLFTVALVVPLAASAVSRAEFARLPESHMGHQKGPTVIVEEKVKGFKKPPTFSHGAVMVHRLDAGLKGPPGRETRESGKGRQKGATIVLKERNLKAPTTTLTRN